MGPVRHRHRRPRLRVPLDGLARGLTLPQADRQGARRVGGQPLCKIVDCAHTLPQAGRQDGLVAGHQQRVAACRSVPCLTGSREPRCIATAFSTYVYHCAPQLAPLLLHGLHTRRHADAGARGGAGPSHGGGGLGAVVRQAVVRMGRERDGHAGAAAGAGSANSRMWCKGNEA